MDLGKKEIEDKWFYLSIILLGAFFLFRIYNQSQIITQFPLDHNNDLSSYIGQLEQLKQYGFHKLVPNWYNGYISFLTYPPGWFFFTLPIYNLLGNILMAAFISHVLLYTLGLIFFLIVGKLQKMSIAKTIFFYLVFYANPIAIGNFIKLGRLPELAGLTLFVAFFALLLYLKDNRITPQRIFLFIVLYSSLILTQPSWLIFSSFFIPGIFLLKNRKEQFMIASAFIICITITSFWLFPFLTSSINTALSTLTGLDRLIIFNRTFFYDLLFSFIVPLFLFFTTFFYFKGIRNNKERLKREVIFYTIPIAISFLYFIRIAAFIPVVNKAYPDSYHMLFIFLGFLFLLKTPTDSYYKSINNFIKLILILLPFAFIIASQFAIPLFRVHTAVDKDIISILPNINVNDKFLIMSVPYPTSPLAFYSYGEIYYNLSTPDGWMPPGAKIGVEGKVVESNRNLLEGDCYNLLRNLKGMNTTALITYRDYCMNLENCGMERAISSGMVCLYRMK